MVIEQKSCGWAIAGALTFQTAEDILQQGCGSWPEPAADGACEVDLGGVTEVDSSALGVMLAWRRRAQAAGKNVRFINWPESLVSLSELYGVREMLE